jgi:colanic acid/amylovoran biosynthesis glycosyltransferase
LTRVDAALLHVYFGHIAPQFLPLMRVWPHPVVVSFHGADAGVNMDKPRHLQAMREVFTHATGILCRSQSLADDLTALGCPTEKIRLWRTGIPLDEWEFTPRALPEDDAWKLIQVCRFVEKKGLDLTIDAFAQFHHQFPNSRLTLIGDGPCLEALKQQTARLQLTDAITFRGFVGQVRVKKAIYDSHLFIHPSRTSADGNREGIPNAALEAMASGIPVIGTTHGGYPEAIKHGISGLLVPENNADLLAQAMHNLVTTPAQIHSMVQAARQTIETQFDRDQQVHILEDCYTGWIQSHRR